MPPAVAPSGRPAPPRRRWLRRALLALALLVLLPLAGAAVFLATFDPDSQKPRIQAAVEAATGRALALNGPIRAKLSLVPTVALADVALANPPGGGFSRPAMLTVRRAEVQLALLPLLLERRLELRRIALDGPDLLLETDAQGRPNWVFAPPARPPADPAAPPAAPRRPLDLAVGRVLLTDGAVAYRPAPAAAPLVLTVARLEALAAGGGGPDGDLRLDGALAAGGVPFALTGRVGPPAALLAPPGSALPARPWPVQLGVEAPSLGARLSVAGEVARPAERRGYRLTATAAVADAARLAAALPSAVPAPPPLRAVEAVVTLADAGPGGAPALSDLRLAAGESDLGALRPGLRLLRLAATLPRPDAPLALDVEARQGDVPLALAGTVGPLAGVLPGAAAGPLPLDLRLALAGGAATATAAGTVADPRALAGVDLAASLRAASLAALAPLAPGAAALPPLRDVAVEARVAGRGPRFAGGLELRDLKATSSAGDLRGALSVALGGARPALTGDLAADRLDLDALRPAPPAAAPPAAPPAAPAPAPAPAARRIPDLPLPPLDALRALDADLRLAAGELRLGGRAYRDLAARAVLRDGAQARLDPLGLTLPDGAGRLALRLAADLAADPPVLQLAARSDPPGLDLGPLLAAYGLPPRATGRLELDADLRGRGRDLRALAATATGHLGLALPGGRLDRALLEALPGDLLRLLDPAVARGGGEAELRCAALRLDAADGQAAVRALLLDAPGLGRVGGEGGVNLRDEALSLRLLPDLRLGPVQLRAPVNLGGTLMRPRVGVSPEAAIAGGLGAFLSLQRSPDRGLGSVAGALGGGGGGPALPDCATALAAARGGRAGPAPPPAPVAEAPAAAAAPAPAPRGLPAPAEELLRRLPIPGLFGR